MKIPLDKYGHINYSKFDKKPSVYIIERNSKGREGYYQYDGVGCSPGTVEGFLAYYFHPDSIWFSSEQWYKATRWGSNYPRDIVISSKETDFIMDKFKWDWKTDEEFDKMNNNVHEEVAKYGIPTKGILQELFNEVKAKTCIEWELDCELDTYEEKWWEAHIPLKLGDKKYLLTWRNCD